MHFYHAGRKQGVPAGTCINISLNVCVCALAIFVITSRPLAYTCMHAATCLERAPRHAEPEPEHACMHGWMQCERSQDMEACKLERARRTGR